MRSKIEILLAIFPYRSKIQVYITKAKKQEEVVG